MNLTDDSLGTELNLIARVSLLIEDAQRLLDAAGLPLVSAHLQHGLDLLRGEPRLAPDGAAAAWIDDHADLFAAIGHRAPPH